MQRQEQHHTNTGQAMQDPTPLADSASVTQGLSDSQDKRSQGTPFLITAFRQYRIVLMFGNSKNAAYYNTVNNARKGERKAAL